MCRVLKMYVMWSSLPPEWQTKTWPFCNVSTSFWVLNQYDSTKSRTTQLYEWCFLLPSPPSTRKRVSGRSSSSADSLPTTVPVNSELVYRTRSAPAQQNNIWNRCTSQPIVLQYGEYFLSFNKSEIDTHKKSKLEYVSKTEGEGINW